MLILRYTNNSSRALAVKWVPGFVKTANSPTYFHDNAGLF